MFRILIVDDERIVLNGIRRMIEEDLELTFPMDIVTASNVPQAIEVLDSFEPDLLLTDIRMPVMDGFDLIRHVRERSHTTSIVILTSHADFGYAQQAIRFNVLDFILKPIDQQILKNTIQKVYEQKAEKEQTRLHSALLEIRNMMLYDLAAQELISDPDLIKKLFPHTYFTIIVLSMPKVPVNGQEILREILLRYYDSCYCFFLQERSQVIAICNHNQFHIQPTNLTLEFSKAADGESFWVGVSISSSSYKALHNLYTNAVQRIFYARHFGESSVLAEISLITFQDCVNIFLENEENKVEQLVQEYLTKIRAAFEAHNELEMIYRSFIHNILLYLENNRIHVSNELIKTGCQSMDYQELAAEIIDQLRLIKRSIQKNYDNKDNYGNDMLTRKLLAYIQQHYREDVSLDDLAAHVGFHPNYVCTVFKKNIGQSYLTCLHKERLSTAKKMLQETDYTMEQIAGEIGYNSASQLARVFRKYEGVSPSAFRIGRG